MMTIITTSDFRLGAYVPNRDDAPNSDIIGNEPILQGFIDEEVKNILVRLLGYDLYYQLTLQFDGNGDRIPAIETRFVNLIDGNGEYRGLKDVLVPWVFCKFLDHDNEDYSTAGVNQIDSEGATRRRPNRKILNEYKKFYEAAIGEYSSVPKVVVNGQGIGFIWSYADGVSSSGFKSLFQYLSEEIATFPEWKPAAPVKEMNHYDI